MICRCGNPKQKRWHLACPACWALVPPALQAQVYHLYKTARSSDAHIESCREAYRIIHVARAKPPGAKEGK